MSPLQWHVWREIRRWLDVVNSQLEQVGVRLMDCADPVELTPQGLAAYVFLIQARHSLTMGSMVLESEVRRAVDLFMKNRQVAFRRKVRTTSCYHEVAENYTAMPRGEDHASSTSGPQPDAMSASHLTILSDADRDSARLFVAYHWYTLENGYIFWNGLVVDRNGVPAHIVPFVDRGRMRALYGVP